VTDPEESDFAKASSTLNEGLRSCRAVISGYRALLRREADNDEDGLDEAAGSLRE
jgi:hypothetical protein